MGTISQSDPTKLFIGILTALPGILPELEERLSSRFGPISDRSETYPFVHTSYYNSSMGTPIQRLFIAFARHIAPETIAEIKCWTNGLETLFAERNLPVQRPVNLDPGYLEEAKIVLASTKNFYHRVLVSDGVYAEVTMHFRDGAWQAFPWTFPDFRSGLYDTFFLQLRNSYRRDMRQP